MLKVLVFGDSRLPSLQDLEIILNYAIVRIQPKNKGNGRSIIKIYCKELAYATVRTGKEGLKSTGRQAIRKTKLDSAHKGKEASVQSCNFSLLGKSQFCLQGLSID